MAIIEELHIDISGAVNAFERLKEAARDAKTELEKLGLEVSNAEWQPIETAPKDGTQIIAAVRDGGGWWIVAVDWRGYWATEPEAGYGVDPTHWMPLPSPPEV